MAEVKVIMPQMGESVTEGKIIQWFKGVGDSVARDEILLSISTDKVDSEIPAPRAGVIVRQLVPEGEVVAVMTEIAILETDPEIAKVTLAAGGGASASAPAKADATTPATPDAATPAKADAAALAKADAAAPAKAEAASGAASTPAPNAPAAVAEPPVTSKPATSVPSAPASNGAGGDGAKFLSPLVMSIASTEGVTSDELARIAGTGAGGRVTKKDVLAFVEARKSGTVSAPKPGAAPSAPAPKVNVPFNEALGGRVEVVAMDNTRRIIAENMLKSKAISPHVHSFQEADFTQLMGVLARHKVDFEKREGFKLSVTAFLVAASVKALQRYPLVNASIVGTDIHIKHDLHIGVAVAADSGLIVPVIKHAEALSLIGMARALNDLATRARSRKLTLDEIQGSTFTISNYGVFGTTSGTPVILQPNVAILGCGAVTKRAWVVGEGIAIRSIGEIALGFDHRLVDGMLGGQFLNEIVQLIQSVDDSWIA